MLDLSQINSGVLRKDISKFNLKEALSEIISIQQMKADVCGVNLSIDMKQFLREDYTVYSDMQRVQQVILNLLSNAIKFTESGGSVTIECTLINQKSDLQNKNHIPFLEASKGHGMVQIAVIDSGIGIKQED